jgi:hypothetical protein
MGLKCCLNFVMLSHRWARLDAVHRLSVGNMLVKQNGVARSGHGLWKNLANIHIPQAARNSAKSKTRGFNGNDCTFIVRSCTQMCIQKAWPHWQKVWP